MTNNYQMPNNATPNAVQPNAPRFILPDMVANDFDNEDFGDDFEGIRLSFRRAKIPSGGAVTFELPTDDPADPECTRTIEGIILSNHPANAYWPGGGFDENTPPICMSDDGKQGIGTPGGTCVTCPFNQYETGVDSKGNPTKGKACKNMRQLYILRSGEYMPIQLSLPPTSLRAFSDFVNIAFANRHRPAWASVVQIGLKKVEGGANSYSVATFSKLYDLEGEEIPAIKAYTMNFREQLQRALDERKSSADSVVEGDVVFEMSAESAAQPAPAPAYKTTVIDGDRDGLPY